ncbi:GlyGly-CTERM sorting domain-containing protein [Aliivibrio fischeri]|uniref:GlyGly-CTERM sorting domain-containing protein n=1 Tax=Aliivibrio fischeri TaxID=668 RepID=UPI00030A1D3A|nr:GlyGly-CTERM sorting domain-containing protein [Aliivibrio fischeri]
MMKKTILTASILMAATSTLSMAQSFGVKDSGQHTYNSYSTPTFNFPSCSINYANLSDAFVQRVGFWVTEDVLEYATREEVKSWIVDQISVANTALKNNCIPLKKEIALIQYVPTPDDIPLYGNPGTVYGKEDLDVTRYLNMVSSNLSHYAGTPLGDTMTTIYSDWKDLSIDRIVNVRPYYPQGNGMMICGQAYSQITKPNLDISSDPNAFQYATYNSFGEVRPNSFSFSTVVYPNNQVCQSQDLIAHELGHNDGLLHERGQQQGNWPEALGFAYSCENQASIMTSGVSNYRTEWFFSDPDVSINGIPCGEVDDGDMDVDAAETILFNMGFSDKYNKNGRIEPYQGVVDAGTYGSLGDISTWNFVTNARHSLLEAHGEIGFTATPLQLSDLNDTVQVEVTRTDATEKGYVYIRTYGSNGVVSGVDIEAEKKVNFAIGETKKVVDFNTTASNLARQDGLVTFELESPYQMDLADNSSVTVTYYATTDGNHGVAKLLKASYGCNENGCGEGNIQLTRMNGIDGDISFELLITDGRSQLIEKKNITFSDTESNKSVSFDLPLGAMWGDLTLRLSAAHPSLVDKSTISFTNHDTDSTNPPVGPSIPSTGDSDGGSLSFFALLSLIGFGVIRHKSETIIIN